MHLNINYYQQTFPKINVSVDNTKKVFTLTLS